MKLYPILFSEASFKYYSSSEESRSKEQFKADRDYKREWNKQADHNFFNNELVKIHFVSGFAGGRCFPNQVNCILGVLEKWSPKGVKKNEISTIGFLPPIFPLKYQISPLAFILDGYVSFASSRDTETEWTSYATDKDKEKHKASGLPKRAGISLNPELKKGVILNKQDFIEKQTDDYNEIVLDNFKIKNVLIDLSTNYFTFKKLIDSRVEEINKIREWCKSNGLSLLDMKTGEDILTGKTSIEIRQEQLKKTQPVAPSASNPSATNTT